MKESTAPISGAISYISPTLQPMQRTASVEISIDNDEGLLKPGMFAKVTIPVKIQTDAILVPRVSLIEDGTTKKQNVFVVEAGVSHRKPVEVGLAQDGLVEIVNGLDEGESVVVAGQHSPKSRRKRHSSQPLNWVSCSTLLRQILSTLSPKK